jgi:hypothetical protein
MSEYLTSLKLADDLFPGLLAGEKEVTIRLGERHIQEDSSLIFEATDGGYPNVSVLVDTVMVMPLNEVPEYFYQADGFESLDHMVESMQRFYPNITEESIVTIVGFVLDQDSYHGA